jgi:hypothetical protein
MVRILVVVGLVVAFLIILVLVVMVDMVVVAVVGLVEKLTPLVIQQVMVGVAFLILLIPV